MKNNQNNFNGLTLLPIKSKVTDDGIVALKELKQTKQFIENHFKIDEGFGVFYLDYGVRFAILEKGELVFHENDFDVEFLQLARIFNEDQELKIWENHDDFYYRVRVDGQGKECEVVKAEQVLWGTSCKDLDNGWVRLTEDRGTEITVPPLKNTTTKPFNRAFLTTYNYITYLKTHQAKYGDCRFVTIGIK